MVLMDGRERKGDEVCEQQVNFIPTTKFYTAIGPVSVHLAFGRVYVSHTTDRFV